MENNLIQIFAVSALLGAGLLQAILAIAGYRSRSERRQREHNLRALQEELMLISSENTALGRRISLLEMQQSQVIRQQEQEHQHQQQHQYQQPIQSGPVGQAYEVAVNLVRKGTEVDELISTCGLSHGEADLIMKLYGTPTERDRNMAPDKPRRQVSPSHSATAAYEAAY